MVRLKQSWGIMKRGNEKHGKQCSAMCFSDFRCRCGLLPTCLPHCRSSHWHPSATSLPRPLHSSGRRESTSHPRLSCIAQGRNVALRPFPPIWAAVAQSESGLEEDLENEESTVHARCPTSPLVGHNGVNMNYKMSVPDY